LDFITYLTGLLRSGRVEDAGVRSRLQALLEERDRFRQWQGVLDLFLDLERGGRFRFLGEQNGARGTSYRFLDTVSRATLVVPAPPLTVRTIEPGRARIHLPYPCPIPTSAATLAESLGRLCEREVIARRLADTVVLRLGGDEVHVVGNPEGEPLDFSQRLLPEYVEEHVVRGGRCVLVSNLRQDPMLRGFWACGTFGAVAIFPLKVEGGQPCLGVMEAWRRAAGDLPDEALDFLSTFASFLAGLAANVRYLESLIFMDTVTGVYNRRSFDEMLLDREMARADRGEEKVALLLADMDDFKAINDRCGHPTGDRVLREVARLLSEKLRPLVDSVARVGGDEFAVVLPGMSSPEGARTVADRLLSLVGEFDFSLLYGALPARVGLSIGGVVYSGESGSGEKERRAAKARLIERADEALYRAKAEGKNRAFVLDEEVLASGK